MTAEELINILKDLNPKTRIALWDFQEELTDDVTVRTVMVLKSIHSPSQELIPVKPYPGEEHLLEPILIIEEKGL